MVQLTNVRSSVWERYKELLFVYGHYYSTIFGLVMINYNPAKPTNTWTHRIAVFYSHLLSITLIIGLPIYFGLNLSPLIKTNNRQHQLQLLVILVNTVLKWVTVALTYAANLANYNAIRNVTTTRQHLENTFGLAWKSPRRRFERVLLTKFALINVTMLLQFSSLGYQFWLEGAFSMRGQFAIYAFVLWNYTENMADYYFFMITSSLKFYRQLKWKVWKVWRRMQQKQNHMQLSCELSNKLEGLSELYKQIFLFSNESTRMQEFQLLGLVLATFLSNLTNAFSIFTLLSTGNSESLPTLIMSCIHAVMFFVDSQILAEIAQGIIEEIREIRYTLCRFNEFRDLNSDLERTLEQFAMRVLKYKTDFRLCGMLNLSRRLGFLIVAEGLQYFITLIQVAINWNSDSAK